MAAITTIRDVKRQDYKKPHGKWNSQLEDEITRSIRAVLSTNQNCFDTLNERFESYYALPCSNIAQFEKRTKKAKGDLWEHFCLMYLKRKGYGECWLIGDTPSEVLEKLNLKSADMGIDIVVKHQNGFFAIQSKYRTNPHQKKTLSLSWNQLSTFYALCARSGPWLKYIVMTNCDYVRRIGKKWKYDQTIAKKSFQSEKLCPRAFWQSMAGLSQGYSLIDEKEESSDHESSEHELSDHESSDHELSESDQDDVKIAPQVKKNVNEITFIGEESDDIPLSLDPKENLRMKRAAFLDKVSKVNND